MTKFPLLPHPRGSERLVPLGCVVTVLTVAQDGANAQEQLSLQHLCGLKERIWDALLA